MLVTAACVELGLERLVRKRIGRLRGHRSGLEVVTMESPR